MGRDKASLPWQGGTLLGHVCEVLAAGLQSPVVVVRAAGQQLPALPAGVEVVEDPVADLGPAAALVTGLDAVAALPGSPAAAFVAATDLPLLSVTTVQRLVAELLRTPQADLVAVMVEGHPQWLAAAYRVAARTALGAAVAAGERRVGAVVGACRGVIVTPQELGLDPVEFTNLNDPRAYARAQDPRTR